MRTRACRFAALPLALLASCSREESSPPATRASEALPSGRAAGGAADGDFISATLSGLFADEPDDRSPDDGADDTPVLSPAAAAIAATWGEPEQAQEGGATTWIWQGAGNLWTLRTIGWPTISDADDAVTVGPESRFTLVAELDGEETRIDLACWEDTHRQELAGVLRGRVATDGQLMAELAGLLPAICAHLGLKAEHRIEQAVQARGVRAGLVQIARLTSSFARRRGYEVLLYQADEPSHSELSALLRQAAVELPDDADMRELLLEMGDFSFDDRGIASALLAAAASLEADDVLVEVLVEMLDRSDELTPANLARILRLAAESIESDEAMAELLDTAIWHAATTGAALAAWDEALATIQSEQALAAVVDSVLSTGDTSVRECVLVTRVAARIGDEALRGKALCSVHIDELDEADVADAFVVAIQGLRDPEVLAGTLTDLLQRRKSPLPLSVRWLAIAQPLLADARLAAVLGAVPAQHLADPAVRSLYLPLATSLPSVEARRAALGRVGVEEPAAAPAVPR